MAPTFSAIDELARGQRALVTRQQLIDLKFTERRIEFLLRAGALRRVQVGIYATLGSVPDWHQKLMAGVLAQGDGALASHSAGAELWDYAHRPARAVEVLVEAAWSLKKRGVHRTTILPDEDRAVRAGIPCTSFERTLCDCTTLLSAFQLGRVLDDGLRRNDASLDRLRRCAARLDSGPGRRLSVVKELLTHRDSAFNPGDSASELDMLKVIRDAGLPEPTQQHPVRVQGHPYVLDFAWPAQRVFAEYYGLKVHSGASAVAHDSERLTRLVGAGWRPLVFTDASSDTSIAREIGNVLATTPSFEDSAHLRSA